MSELFQGISRVCPLKFFQIYTNRKAILSDNLSLHIPFFSLNRRRAAHYG
jgi:hypothetical protein